LKEVFVLLLWEKRLIALNLDFLEHPLELIKAIVIDLTFSGLDSLGLDVLVAEFANALGEGLFIVLDRGVVGLNWCGQWLEFGGDVFHEETIVGQNELEVSFLDEFIIVLTIWIV
jgi:hypothetical protein